MSNLETLKYLIINYIKEKSSERVWQENYMKFDETMKDQWYEEIIRDCFPHTLYPFICGFVKECFSKYDKNIESNTLLEIIQYIESNKKFCLWNKNFELSKVSNYKEIINVFGCVYCSCNLKYVKKEIDYITEIEDEKMKLKKISLQIQKKMNDEMGFREWIENESFNIKNSDSSKPVQLYRQTNDPCYLKCAKKCINENICFKDLVNLYEKGLEDVKLDLLDDFDEVYKQRTPPSKKRKLNRPPEIRRSKRFKKNITR